MHSIVNREMAVVMAETDVLADRETVVQMEMATMAHAVHRPQEETDVRHPDHPHQALM